MVPAYAAPRRTAQKATVCEARFYPGSTRCGGHSVFAAAGGMVDHNLPTPAIDEEKCTTSVNNPEARAWQCSHNTPTRKVTQERASSAAREHGRASSNTSGSSSRPVLARPRCGRSQPCKFSHHCRCVSRSTKFEVTTGRLLLGVDHLLEVIVIAVLGTGSTRSAIHEQLGSASARECLAKVGAVIMNSWKPPRMFQLDGVW
jgi:hypothetical protein